MQTTQPAPSAQSPLLTRTWYAYYVLGMLTLGYILNTMDRSQILAAALQSIKKEFVASDFQMGVLTGIPFAVFYMRQPLGWNFLWAGLCLVGAVFFMFR